MNDKERFDQWMEAVALNELDRVSLWLEQMPALARMRSERGISGLMHAALCGSLDCLRWLLPLSDVEARTVEERTALMLAAVGGELGAVRELLPHSTPDAVDVAGVNALMWAVSRKDVGICELLCERTTLTHQDKEGKAVWAWAINGCTPGQALSPKTWAVLDLLAPHVERALVLPWFTDNARFMPRFGAVLEREALGALIQPTLATSGVAKTAGLSRALQGRRL